MFKVGDKVRRIIFNSFWSNLCARNESKTTAIFTVASVKSDRCFSIQEIEGPHNLLMASFELVKSKQRKYI